ncbi:hypothetical protein AC578_632 [Pseudocercospora eumusae]|uniref:Uncharacterized protein n=1 Tax=Pseudocercospora eumusae TaxID=321146 RepID=A0A139HFM3_9PEZI|nr:hypothetical protein AC578_632 [Pseudocercospora eumusae]
MDRAEGPGVEGIMRGKARPAGGARQHPGSRQHLPPSLPTSATIFPSFTLPLVSGPSTAERTCQAPTGESPIVLGRGQTLQDDQKGCKGGAANKVAGGSPHLSSWSTVRAVTDVQPRVERGSSQGGSSIMRKTLCTFSGRFLLLVPRPRDITTIP